MNREDILKILFLLTIVVITIYSIYFYNKHESYQYRSTVKRVIDGDTIELTDGSIIRYIGVNTPEVESDFTDLECFGKEASLKNRELVLGKSVTLETDRTDKDIYQRDLRYVWVEGILVNDILVKEGFAYSSAYPPDIKYQIKFDKSEQIAKNKNLGLWGQCH